MIIFKRAFIISLSMFSVLAEASTPIVIVHDDTNVKVENVKPSIISSTTSTNQMAPVPVIEREPSIKLSPAKIVKHVSKKTETKPAENTVSTKLTTETMNTELSNAAPTYMANSEAEPKVSPVVSPNVQALGSKVDIKEDSFEYKSVLYTIGSWLLTGMTYLFYIALTTVGGIFMYMAVNYLYKIYRYNRNKNNTNPWFKPIR